jgi:naphthalene 1,2-dioxygenase system ferredoxin subunit
MNESTPAPWVDAAGIDEVPDGGVKGVEIRGNFVALYRLDGKVFATSDICTHEAARLSDGWIENGEIECPLHGARFKIENGECLGPYGGDLRCFPARVRQERIEIALPPEGGDQC